MTKIDARILQEVSDKFELIELLLAPQELELILELMIAAYGDIKNPNEGLVVHFMPIREKVGSALNPDVKMKRIATVVHEEIIKIPKSTVSIDPDAELKRLHNLMRLLKYKSR